MATTHQIDFTQVANLFDEIERKVAVLPAHVQRDGKDVAIVLSAQQYLSLAARGASEADPEIMALHEKSVKQRRSVYEALARYERDHPEDN